MSDLCIRTMRPDEISIAVKWAAAEGWNPGLADDACFAAVDPEGFLIGELDGAPAATVSCVNYSASFAFLGFSIVREDLRGCGYGLRIWNAAIAHAGHFLNTICTKRKCRSSRCLSATGASEKGASGSSGLRSPPARSG